MNSKKPTIFDKGMLNLIRQKLIHGSHAEDIKGMLVRAGFLTSDIVPAIQFVMKEIGGYMIVDRNDIEQNDFLPPLKKNNSVCEQDLDIQNDLENGLNKVHKKVFCPIEKSKLQQIVESQVQKKGLFSGRLRRKDFIMGILFFFGIGFVFFAIITSWIQMLFPNVWNNMALFIEQDTFGVWLLFVPFIFAPITLMMLSLITRRLHNLALPGWISFIYLFVFISPFGDFYSYPLFGIHIVLFTLFIVLISKKGHPSPNSHGVLPPSKGSFFERILGRG